MADDYQYPTGPVFYSDIKFCKFWMKFMHPFKSYWMETKSVTAAPMPPQTNNIIPMCLPCYAGDTKTSRQATVQLVPIGMLIVRWNIHLPNSTKILSITYYLFNICIWVLLWCIRVIQNEVCICVANDIMLKATVTTLMEETLVDNFL